MSVGSPPSGVKTIAATDEKRPLSLQTIGVCHIASGDRWAGAEAQVATLLKALQRIADISVCAIFLNEGQLASQARELGIETQVLPEGQQAFLQIVAGASRFLRDKKIRILHSHRYKENALAALVARRCQVPFHVSSVHGAPEPFSGWRRYKHAMIGALDYVVARYFTDRVISVSEELRTKLTSRLPSQKVVTIYNGIDEEKVFSQFSMAEAKQRLGIPARCRVVGTAGRLAPVKRLDLFLHAAQIIVHSQPDVRFLIAGEGTEEQPLKELARLLKIEDCVLFLGHRGDIYDVLRAMDAFVLCSDHEGLPMALLEALYLGVPVVARPVGGIPEVIEDGVNGMLVASPDAADLAAQCLRIIADEDRRKRMVQAASRTVAERFAVQHTAREVAQLYRSLGSDR